MEQGNIAEAVPMVSAIVSIGRYGGGYGLGIIYAGAMFGGKEGH